MALIGCLLFTGKYLFDAREIAQEAADLRNGAALSRQRYDDIVRTLPSIPTDNGTLKRIIDHYTSQEKRSITPTSFYHEISRALQTEPAVELDSLDWEIGGADSAREAGKPRAESKAVPEDSESIVVHGTLRLAPDADTRQLLSTFNRFVGRLKSDEKRQVNILQQPFDIESGKSLRSGDTKLEDSKPRSFRVQVIRKIGS